MDGIPTKLKCFLGPFDGRVYETGPEGWPKRIFIPFPKTMANIPPKGEVPPEVREVVTSTGRWGRCAVYSPALQTPNPDSWVLKFVGYEEK